VTGNAHRLFGLAFGVSAAAIVTPLYGVPAGVAVTVASFPGATAPDWMEIRRGDFTVIPHRTITHWPAPWLALLAISIAWFPYSPLGAAVLLGFSLGALSHVLGDAGTPSGVPVWHPGKRHSLKLWDSRSSEVWPVLVAWVIAVLLFRSLVL
jgi:membrane-bound metal-dependent hydrolase YbcI (DUF457 family)